MKTHSGKWITVRPDFDENQKMNQIDEAECLVLEDVTTHNLQIPSLKIPLNALTVVSGVSGSGKSSLVFDTLYGEAYRRYVESLSSFARQYLKALPRPGIRAITNLPPGIAVRQARSGATNRSTVGTMTELNDLLRNIFAARAQIICSTCSRIVELDTGDSIAAKILARQSAAASSPRVLICAPLKLDSGKTSATATKAKVSQNWFKEVKVQIAGQGFTRIWRNGEVLRLEEAKNEDFIDAGIIIDRLPIGAETRNRLAEASHLALKAGKGVMWLVAESATVPEVFYAGLTCCGKEYSKPTVSLLSFNHPQGACPRCQGFGAATELNWTKIIPDLNMSLAQAGVAPWNFGSHSGCYEWAAKSAKKLNLTIWEKKFSDFSADEWQWLKTGILPQRITESSRKANSVVAGFDGIEGYFRWLDTKRYKPHYRMHAARFRRYVTCPECHGARLIPQALACRIQGKNIADVSSLTLNSVRDWLLNLRSENSHHAVESLDEAQARVGYLIQIGVGYLTMDRAARTLSGGEHQRINMARCLGSALTDTMYCLDEPTAGLHPRDTQNLIGVLHEMRDLGNTVVVVEHEAAVLEAADWRVEIGPGAGRLGGTVMWCGSPSANTGAGASDSLTPISPAARRSAANLSECISLTGAATHNLRGVRADFPLGALTVVCGVSGSGKTSLIQHTLFPLLSAAIEKSPGNDINSVKGSVGPASLIRKHQRVLMMSQGGLGRSTRSNIATYLGAMDTIRKMLAALPEAKQLKLQAGAFSFNTPGGRCEECKGLGTVVEDLSFLGEMEVVCPSCQGRRFGDDVLSVRYKNKNLIEILQMTVEEARAFFFDLPVLARVLDRVIDLGLGYISLNQSTSSFSGGEAQRLRLVNVLAELDAAGAGQCWILIFDEPTLGLSRRDVALLIKHFRSLVDAGHMVIVVEHNLDMIRSADWLIDVGPDSADRGGEIVFQGPPDRIGSADRSITKRFL